MKHTLTILAVLITVIFANAQTLQYNRFATTPEGTQVNGNVLTNLSLSQITNSGSIITNGNKTVYQFLAGTNINSLWVKNCSIQPSAVGFYTMTYSNSTGGGSGTDPYMVFKQTLSALGAAAATNWVQLGEPFAYGTSPTYDSPFWSISTVGTNLISSTIKAVDGQISHSSGIFFPDVSVNPWKDVSQANNLSVFVFFSANTTNSSGFSTVQSFIWGAALTNNSTLSWVSPYGDDANDGFTILTPFQSPAIAAAARPFGSTVIIMPGKYSTFNTPFGGFSFVGMGKSASIVNGVFGGANSANYENMGLYGINSAPITPYGDSATATNFINFSYVSFGNLNSNTIDCFYPTGAGNYNFKFCDFSSTWDTENSGGGGLNMYVDHCTFMAFNTTSNYSGGAIQEVRGFHLLGTDSLQIYNSTIQISNNWSGLVNADAANTNACIVMDGTTCQLYIGNTILDNSRATNSTTIAFCRGATPAQVHWINAHAVTQTNLAIGTAYTNSSPSSIFLSGLSIVATEAAVAGRNSVQVQISGGAGIGYTNSIYNDVTAATQLFTGAVTNVPMSIVIPPNSSYKFVDTSTGAGNSCSLSGGQIYY